MRALDVRLARDAQAALGAAGIAAQAMAGEWRPAPEGEDITIVAAQNAEDGEAFAAAARRGSPSTLAVLMGLRTADPPACALSAPAAFTGAVALDAPAEPLQAQVNAWLRVAVAEDERERRIATARALQLTVPKAVEPPPLKALYIGAPNAVFLSVERALTECGGTLIAAFSSQAGFDHLHDEVFDAVILNGAEAPAGALSLCAALRRNGNLCLLPTLFIARPGDRETAKAAIARRASAVAFAGEPFETSMAWLFHAIQCDRRRRAAEHELGALQEIMGEPRTGLFKQDAFHRHLIQLAEAHHASGRPLALAVLRVLPAHGARQPPALVWARGFNEVGSLASQLLRAPDSGAAIGTEFIAAALPATGLDGAKRLSERIAAVAECTAFASGEGGAGPLVFEQSAVELQAGESGPAMLARALRALDWESVPA